MENRVGDNTPSAAKMADLLKRAQALLSDMQAFCITLSKEERKALPRGRKDSEVMISRVGSIAQAQGVSVPGMSLTSMQNDVALLAALAPLEATFATLLGTVEDTMAQADSEAWQAFLAYYGVLSSLASRNPEIEAQLAPVVQYMRTPRKRPIEPPVK